MTRHTTRGAVPSIYQDDGYGNLVRINFDQLLTRLISGWREL